MIFLVHNILQNNLFDIILNVYNVKETSGPVVFNFW